MNPTTIKWAIAAGLLVGYSGLWFYLGTLKESAAMARMQRDGWQTIATAVLNERKAEQEQRAKDHITEQTHAATILHIDSAPAIRTPVIVYAPGALCRAMPTTETKTGAEPADPAGRGGEPVDRGRDIRPTLEEVKKRLERVMADYRQLDAEW